MNALHLFLEQTPSKTSFRLGGCVFLLFLTTPRFMAVPPMFIELLKMNKEIDRKMHDLHMHPALNMSIHININVRIRQTI